MMKDLKEYIKEGLFDDLDKREEVGGLNAATEDIKNEIYKWLCKNTRIRIFRTKLKYNFTDDGIIVDYTGDVVFNDDIESLTNGVFQWGEVGGSFYCNGCQSLKSLEGAPKKVGENFTCNYCKSLTSLEGAPKKTRAFDCSWCDKLTSLEGAPKETESICCRHCPKLVSIEGCPKEMRWFDCGCCESLKSLKGGPIIVTGDYHCYQCDLKDLVGAPKEAGSFDCSWCKNLKSLKHGPTKLTDKHGYADFNCTGCVLLTSLEGAPKEMDKLRCWNCYNLKEVGDTLKDVRIEIFCKGVPNAKTLFKDFNPEIVNDFI